MCREGDGMQPEQREVGPDGGKQGVRRRAGDGLH